jgi:glycosyltransferase involved in cell wall biosynthesis
MKLERMCIFGEERAVHTRRWVEGLRSLGIHVDLITLIKEPRFDMGGISLKATSKISYLTKIGKLRSIVKKLDPQIFHAHHASSFGFLASYVDHPAKILSVWGYDVITFPYRNFINRAIINRALNPTTYITGIDRKPSDKVVIGMAKSLKPKYGVDVLIRAFGLLAARHGNIYLKIAGKGKHEKEYKKLTRELKLDDRVEFLGFVEHSKLPPLFAQFDIFAMPSEDESFGVAAVEASATRLPVVATDVGGVSEVVIDNVTGYLVEKKNVNKLAEAIEKLIVNPELRLEMGKAGRDFVIQKYIWKDNLLAMKNLYEKILAERGK